MPEDKANAALNNPQMKKFFSAQPLFVQECIMQTGVGASTETELKQCAENLSKKQPAEETKTSRGTLPGLPRDVSY